MSLGRLLRRASSKASDLLTLTPGGSGGPSPVLDGEIIYSKNNVCVHPPEGLQGLGEHHPGEPAEGGLGGLGLGAGAGWAIGLGEGGLRGQAWGRLCIRVPEPQLQKLLCHFLICSSFSVCNRGGCHWTHRHGGGQEAKGDGPVFASLEGA